MKNKLIIVLVACIAICSALIFKYFNQPKNNEVGEDPNITLNENEDTDVTLNENPDITLNEGTVEVLPQIYDDEEGYQLVHETIKDDLIVLKNIDKKTKVYSLTLGTKVVIGTEKRFADFFNIDYEVSEVVPEDYRLITDENEVYVLYTVTSNDIDPETGFINVADCQISVASPYYYEDAMKNATVNNELVNKDVFIGMTEQNELKFLYRHDDIFKGELMFVDKILQTSCENSSVSYFYIDDSVLYKGEHTVTIIEGEEYQEFKLVIE